eukprot:m51a1_g12760 hypothetical protein (273) ;mRNA; f:1428-2450
MGAQDVVVLTKAQIGTTDAAAAQPAKLSLSLTSDALVIEPAGARAKWSDISAMRLDYAPFSSARLILESRTPFLPGSSRVAQLWFPNSFIATVEQALEDNGVKGRCPVIPGGLLAWPWVHMYKRCVVMQPVVRRVASVYGLMLLSAAVLKVLDYVLGNAISPLLEFISQGVLHALSCLFWSLPRWSLPVAVLAFLPLLPTLALMWWVVAVVLMGNKFITVFLFVAAAWTHALGAVRAVVGLAQMVVGTARFIRGFIQGRCCKKPRAEQKKDQ